MPYRFFPCRVTPGAFLPASTLFISVATMLLPATARFFGGKPCPGAGKTAGLLLLVSCFQPLSRLVHSITM